MSAFPEVSIPRWRDRPLLARLTRAAAVGIPLAAGVGSIVVVASIAPTVFSATGQVLRVALGCALAVAVVVAVERMTRRVLPLAALLDLAIRFPSNAPARSRIAWRAIRHAGPTTPDGAPGRDGTFATVRDLDAAAADVLVAYASAATTMHPRSHGARVSALAALVATRLDLPVLDRDRLQWALLIRESGLNVGSGGPAHPLAAWLGPHAALLSGTFTGVAADAHVDAVRSTAQVVAVADAYAVISASHPYRRALSPAEVGGRLQELAGQWLQPEAVDALLTIPHARRRRALSATLGKWPPMAQGTGMRRPAFALAAVALVVVVLAVGDGASQISPAVGPDAPTIEPAVAAPGRVSGPAGAGAPASAGDAGAGNRDGDPTAARQNTTDRDAEAASAGRLNGDPTAPSSGRAMLSGGSRSSSMSPGGAPSSTGSATAQDVPTQSNGASPGTSSPSQPSLPAPSSPGPQPAPPSPSPQPTPSPPSPQPQPSPQPDVDPAPAPDPSPDDGGQPDDDADDEQGGETAASPTSGNRRPSASSTP